MGLQVKHMWHWPAWQGRMLVCNTHEDAYHLLMLLSCMRIRLPARAHGRPTPHHTPSKMPTCAVLYSLSSSTTFPRRFARNFTRLKMKATGPKKNRLHVHESCPSLSVFSSPISLPFYFSSLCLLSSSLSLPLPYFSPFFLSAIFIYIFHRFSLFFFVSVSFSLLLSLCLSFYIPPLPTVTVILLASNRCFT